jgi:WD40-like Beta Propeller Repeat
LPIDSSHATTWPSIYPFNLAVPRPGSESWAVYRTYPDSGQGDIDLLSRDGTAVRLTRSPGEDRPQSFSPDGRYLLFLTTRWSSKGWSDVAILDLTNLQVRRLTAGNATYADAHWSPDGSRIVYDREPLAENGQEICTVDANGANPRCRRISNMTHADAIGWLDEHRVLINPGVSRIRTFWAAYDIDRGVVGGTTFPREGGISLDPSGKWALIRSSANGQITKVSPAERADLARVIAGDATNPPDVWFASPNAPTSFLDSIAIAKPFGSLAPGVPDQLVALGWSKARHRMSPVTVRWRSLTPSIANVDSLGVFVARDTGYAVVELSAGGWRVKRDTLRVRPAAVTVFADERWDGQVFERWRPFGDPQPRIVRADTVAAFDNNGDGNFFSGASLRDGVDPRRGIAMDFELSTPITQTQWQVVIAGLESFGDNEEQVNKWNHKTGYLPNSQGSGCFFVYPEGEGVAATTDPTWFPAFRSAMGDSSYRIDTGKWYHVRLQLFPDGRCGIAIDGKPLIISLGSTPSINPFHAIIEGNSVGTRMLVGHVLIRSGVPTDMDWASLKFTGLFWERSPDDKNLRISRRH